MLNREAKEMSDTTPKAALLENSATFTRTIDTEAMKRLNAEIEARARAEAEWKVAEAEKCAAMKRAEPEPVPTTLSIREFLNSASIKSGNARILELCQKHAIDIDKNPWPPNFLKEKEDEPEPPKAEQKGQLILFPPWADDRRATAQAVFRSALFPALNFKKGRPFLKEKRIASVEGVTVFFTGEQFDQSDLDVYLELLQIAHETPLGMECNFTAYSLLKALGRKTGKTQYRQLHSQIIRLCAGVADMTDHGVRYFDSLVHGGTLDEDTKRYRIFLTASFARFFKAGLWASLDIQQRCALGRNQTAKALHAYYSTHAAPGPHRYETLAKLIGLENSNKRQCKADIIKGCEALKRVGLFSDYEAGAEAIKAAINQTSSQSRHIVQKIIKARRQRQAKGTV
jgi:hypothetical protein